MSRPDKRLRPALAASLPDIPAHLFPGGFDTIGDIALLSMPQVIRAAASHIGEAILSLHKHIRVVALREGDHSGAQRLVPIKVVAGEKRLATLHRENGVALFLDLAAVYFSTRMAEERLRLARYVQPGEKVCVLCSGAGPYPLVIGRHSQAQEVHGIELNTNAHALGLKNVRANKCQGRVHLHLGEAANMLHSLQQDFDRIIIALPWNAASLVAASLAHLRPMGMLHCYAMERNGHRSGLIQQLHSRCAAVNRRAEILHSGRCGHCGPGLYRVCHDALIH